MSSSTPIPHKKKGLDIASSFRSASPIAQEILARDIAECSEDEAAEDVFDDDDESGSGSGSESGPVLYQRPTGVAFGYRRPSLVTDQVNGPILTKVEKKQSRDAERSLLRDNHILPPKHAPEKKPRVLTRLYKALFSTKVPRAPEDEEVPRITVQPSETSPLLPGSTESPDSPHEHLNEQWDAAVASGIIETTWQRETKTITIYSRSLILTFLLQYSINIASIFAVGRIGKVELGAVSLATMTANILCYAPMQGLATSLDTLCAQAYGSGHKHLVGLQLQRMTYFLWTLVIPVAVLFFFAKDILLHIVPDPLSAEFAGLYLKVIIAGIPGFAAFEAGKRFVQSQGLFIATTYVLLIAAPLNIFINWFLVWHVGWGFIGAPISVAITQTLMPILLLSYVLFVDGSQCWGGFTPRALTNWGPMIRLALPGMVMVMAEWLAFEILTLVTSQFGTSYLAAQSILVTLTSTTFMIPFPVSIAASTRVANLIGARLINAAKTSAKVAFWAGCIIGLFNLVLLSSLRYQLPLLFTQDEEVIAIVAKVMPLVAVMQVFDAMAAVAHGLLRGIGKQSFGGYANLSIYYLIALPISFATAFALDWKLTGLWLGTTIGLALVGAVEYWYTYISDWEQSARDAENRNAAG
ncbi:multidrug and toxin extrusion protein [Hypoxylon trugodes]|uniref:multidrug and toxin extrusion protein n=1 Tax=Hypoxylon trugodes TaxID=326681 RepID=UPI00219052F6|nr:multidrug and toxin extrusion protein [Hypoxylon trugodes]KAI1386422.1 multidrug and toxin extrusion protein [Hypoxylon trugodes]